MNDYDLDEMLDQWKAPPMRASAGEDLRTAFRAVPQQKPRARGLRRIVGRIPRMRIGRIAVATVGTAMLLFAIVQMSPQTIRMASSDYQIPFYIEFDFEVYAANGRVQHANRVTTFPYGGNEITISVKEPGDSIVNRFRGLASSIREKIILAVPSLVLPKRDPTNRPGWFADFVRSGCSSRQTVIGHENIAGHSATITQFESPRERWTSWLAPDLDCFPLKLTLEVRESNGDYRMLSRKEAVKVVVNR